MDYGSGEYRRHNPNWHAEDSAWKAAKIRACLDRAGLEPATILDLGCGAGGVLAALAATSGDAAASFLGCDPSEDAIRQATEAHHDPRLRFSVGGPPQDTPVEVTLLIDVLEHVADYFALLRIARDTSPYLVTHIPIELTVSAVIRRRPIMATREAVGHIHLFNRDVALAVLDESGFDVLDTTYTARALERPMGTLKSRLAAVPRRVVARASEEVAANWLGGYSLLLLARARADS